MSISTISIKPIPKQTTIQKIKGVFHAYTLSNVHIEGNVAYVEFNDPGDLQTLEMSFVNEKIQDLDYAKIDISDDFDWSKVKKKQSEHKNSDHDQKKPSEDSEKHVDLAKADLKHLIVVENCNENILKNISSQNLKKIFQQFTSVNRILKRKKEVILQFLDLDQIQLIDTKFPNFNVPQLGNESFFEKAEDTHLNADQFSTQWSKMNEKETQHTQTSSQKNKKHQVLHHDIIPPFQKKTSMQVNFLKQHENQKPELHKAESISEATTHQQLDFPSESEIIAQKEEQNLRLQKQKSVHLQRLQKQEQKKTKILQEQSRKIAELEHARNLQLQRQLEEKIAREKQQKARKDEQLRVQKENQQRKRKQQEQKRIRKEEQYKRQQKDEQDRRIRKEEQDRRIKKLEQERKIRQIEQAERRARILKQEREKQLRQEQDRKIKQAQRQRVQRQIKDDEFKESAQVHHIPTKGEQVQRQLQFVKKVGQRIQPVFQQTIIQAEQEGTHLLKSGLKSVKKAVATSEQKWNVAAQIISRPISGTQRELSKMIMTITLALWVIYLLIQ